MMETETQIQINELNGKAECNVELCTVKSKTDNINNDSIMFDKDLYHFYMLYSLKYSTTNSKFIILSIICLFVLIIQFVSLYAFTYTFTYHWGQQFISKTEYIVSDYNSYGRYNSETTSVEIVDMIPDNTGTSPSEYLETFDEKVFVNLTICTVFIVLFVMLCYLLQYIHSFVSSICVYLQYNDKYPQNMYNYIIMLNFINIVLILSCWMCVTYIIFFGVYFDILATSNIIFLPIVIVFILQINNWTYSWIISKYFIQQSKSNEFWNVKVNYNQYSKAVFKTILLFIGILVSWILSWWFVCHNIGYSLYGYDSLRWLFGWNGSYFVSTIILFVIAMMTLCASNKRVVLFDLFSLCFSAAQPIILLLVNYFTREQTMDPNGSDDAGYWYKHLYGPNSSVNVDEAKNILTILDILCVIALIFWTIDFGLFVNRFYHNEQKYKKYRIVVSLMAPIISLIVVICIGIYIPYAFQYIFCVLFLCQVAFVLNITNLKAICGSKQHIQETEGV